MKFPRSVFADTWEQDPQANRIGARQDSRDGAAQLHDARLQRARGMRRPAARWPWVLGLALLLALGAAVLLVMRDHLRREASPWVLGAPGSGSSPAVASAALPPQPTLTPEPELPPVPEPVPEPPPIPAQQMSGPTTSLLATPLQPALAKALTAQKAQIAPVAPVAPVVPVQPVTTPSASAATIQAPPEASVAAAPSLVKVLAAEPVASVASAPLESAPVAPPTAPSAPASAPP